MLACPQFLNAVFFEVIVFVVAPESKTERREKIFAKKNTAICECGVFESSYLEMNPHKSKPLIMMVYLQRHLY